MINPEQVNVVLNTVCVLLIILAGGLNVSNSHRMTNYNIETNAKLAILLRTAEQVFQNSLELKRKVLDRKDQQTIRREKYKEINS